MKFYLLLLVFASYLVANPLQEAIDTATPYSTLKLPSGTYKGNITVNKPLTIIGKGKDIVIRGSGNGSVITITSSHVSIKNLIISGSGERMDRIDSGISIKKAKQCEISNCKILDCLYGID